MIHNLVKGKQIILASASPRRKHIFEMIGIKALQMPANIEEENIYRSPAKLVKYHAKNKAKFISKNFDSSCLIVAADTLVYQNKKVLGKPETKRQAAEFLNLLSDDFHYVYTGVAIAYKNQIHLDHEKTKVFFKALSEEEIAEYIATKEPLDKAGAYGIQGFGSQFIDRLVGCYFNVMGFPVTLFYQMLRNIL